jgi:hypothetical protein
MLRAKAHGLTDEEEVALSASLAAMIHKGIAQMRPFQLQEVAQFIDLVLHDQGCTTPAEAFITDLVSDHYAYGGITPERVAEQLDPDNSDGFRFNFVEAIEVARRMRAIYPKLVA